MVNCFSTSKIFSPDQVKDTTASSTTLLKDNEKDEEFFKQLFKSSPAKFDSILAHRDDWNIQVIYTQINRGQNGIPQFQHHYFNKNNSRYFYPASTVKLPIALLALQKLNELKIPGLDRSTTMITETGYNGQKPVYNDPNTLNGKPSIAQYIKKIMLVSDNDAYNRLYEFLGQEYINTELKARGFTEAQILHRLDIVLTDEQNRHTNPVSFYNNLNKVIYSQPAKANQKKYSKRDDHIGNGYYTDSGLVNKPMNFSQKNRISLEDLHLILTGLIFPEKVAVSKRFNITEEDRRFVLECMSRYPAESTYPFYDSSYYDAYGKFILYGSMKGSLPKNIRIFNKSGEAYGQLTDVAYVVDFEKKIEFMVSATIYCNGDGILNDDTYDYTKVGFPFMKDLGKALYDHELKRKRHIVPDLSSMVFSYDK